MEGKKKSLDVYAVDMKDRCILVLDYLVRRQCMLDLREMRVTVGGWSVPPGTVRHGNMPVTTKRTTIIPPRSKLSLPCEVAGTWKAGLILVKYDSQPMTEGQSLKLQSPWEGSYTVVKRLSDLTYCIRGGGRRKSKIYSCEPAVEVSQTQAIHVGGRWRSNRGSGRPRRAIAMAATRSFPH